MIRFFSCVSFPILLSVSGQAQAVVKGRADLSQYSFEDDGPFDLSGTWEFYWNKLLSPDDFKSSQDPEWMRVPGSWHHEAGYPVLGFATYRLKLALPPKQNSLSIYFPIINASAKIWINGRLVHETGKVAKAPDLYSPGLTATVVSIPGPVANADIIIQVANYTSFNAGIGGVPVLDKSTAVFAQVNRFNGISNLFAGCLLALCIYQLVLYFLYNRGKPYLWLALICLGVALRSLITHRGSFLLPNLFPMAGWEFWKKVEFESIYAITALFPLYVYDLFSGAAPKKPLTAFIIVAAVLCLAVVVTPQYIYGRLLEVCHLSLIAGFIYAVYSISCAWRAGNSDARIILFGVLACFPFILAEILKNSVFFSVNIRFPYLVESGMLVFLLFQVYLLANHYVKSYRNLETLNQDLESIIEARTVELKTANAVKDRLLSVMSHDIKSPLNALRGILQVYNKGKINKDEFQEYARRIENDLSKTSVLVENILYWTASQLRGVRLKIERFNLHRLIEENVQLFQSLADNKKIVLRHNAPKDLMATTDRSVLNLVLRNLIANAIKFSFENSEVGILVTLTDDSLLIQVKDQGVGMDGNTIEKLMSPALNVSANGTGNEKGMGLGLALCRNYLQKAGGRLTIESTEGKGSTFNIQL